MSDNDVPVNAVGTIPAAQPPRRPAQGSWSDIFTLPRPLRELFSKFPLVTYVANELPSRSPKHKGNHALYIFSDPEATQNGEPSYNPTCLKWQTYLSLRGIDFATVASNNHASPTGSLPFILPGSLSTQPSKPAILQNHVPASKIRQWVDDQRPQDDAQQGQENMKEDIYFSLLDHRLRRAWLYQLYLHPSNEPLLRQLYCSHSSSALIAQATLWSLRSAATEEIRKSNPTHQVNEEALLREGEEALDALEELLGKDDWFLGRKAPELFDAAVFAYTHLLLEEDLAWGWNPLGGILKGKRVLVGHRRKTWKKAYGRR